MDIHQFYDMDTVVFVQFLKVIARLMRDQRT